MSLPMWLRRARIWLVAALTYAFFLSGSDPNQATRFSLTEAIATRGAPDITPVQYRTIDKGYEGGRFYSDKAPGVSMLAVPPFAIMNAADAVFGIPSHDRNTENAKLYFLCLLFAAAPGAGAVYLLKRLAMFLGCREPAAELAAFAYAFGTLAFPFSTVLFGHQLAAFLVLACFTLAVEARASGRLQQPRVLAALGALGATCVVVEYPTALLFVVLGIALLFASAERGAIVKSVGRAVLWVTVGAAPLLLAHALFLYWSYGRLALPYMFVSEPFFRANMSSGFFGIGIPTATATLGSLVSPYRGILFYCPVLALFLVGVGAWMASGRALSPLTVILSALGVHLLFAFSYYAWDGGRSIGPRHLVPIIPFLVLPIAFFADRSRWTFTATAGVTLVSCLVMLFVTYVLVQLPEGDPRVVNSFYDLVLPTLDRGGGAINGEDAFVPYARADAATNWGIMIGLGARASLYLVPLLWLGAYLPGFLRRPTSVARA